MSSPSHDSSLFGRFRSVFGRRNSSIPDPTDMDPANKGTAIVVSKAKQATGEFPKFLPMIRQMQYYYSNPKVKTVADVTVEQIIQRGFYFKVKGDNKAQVKKAKDALDKFAREVRLKKIIKSWVREGIVTGNSFTEMLDPDDLTNLAQVPISSIYKIERNADGSYKEIIQLMDGEQTSLKPERFLQFKLVEVDGQAFGISLIYALAIPQLIDGQFRPSHLDNWNMMTDAMVRALERHVAPLVSAYYEDASSEFLDAEATKIRNARNGDVYLTNKKPVWEQLAIDPRARFESYIQHVDEIVDVGLAHPVIRLLTDPSALADAQAAADIMEPFLFGIQDNVKELIDFQIVPRILKRENIDPEKIIASFEWGAEDSADIEKEDLWDAVDRKVLMDYETRRILREKYRWPLDDDTPLDEVREEMEQEGGNGQDQNDKGKQPPDDEKDGDDEGTDEEDPDNGRQASE